MVTPTTATKLPLRFAETVRSTLDGLKSDRVITTSSALRNIADERLLTTEVSYLWPLEERIEYMPETELCPNHITNYEPDLCAVCAMIASTHKTQQRPEIRSGEWVDELAQKWERRANFFAKFSQ